MLVDGGKTEFRLKSVDSGTDKVPEYSIVDKDGAEIAKNTDKGVEVTQSLVDDGRAFTLRNVGYDFADGSPDVGKKDILYLSNDTGICSVKKKDGDESPLKISMADKKNMIQVQTGSPEVKLDVDDDRDTSIAYLKNLGRGDNFEIEMRTIFTENEDDVEKLRTVRIRGTGIDKGEVVKVGFEEDTDKLICENVYVISYEEDVEGEQEKPVEGISFKDKLIEVKARENLKLKADITPADADAEIKYTSSDEKVAKVSGDTVTGVAPGKVTITAVTERTIVDDEGKFSKQQFSDTCTLMVRDPKFFVAKQKMDITGFFKEKDNIKKYVIKEKAEKKVAKVNKKGIFKAKKSGTVTVTGLDSSGSDLESVTFTVEAPKVKVKKFAPKADDPKEFEGMDNLEGSAILPDVWESDNEAVAKVDEKSGHITLGESKGTAVITAYYGEGKNAAKLKFKIKVK